MLDRHLKKIKTFKSNLSLSLFLSIHAVPIVSQYVRVLAKSINEM
jgi:hypothetical protein